MNGALSDMPYGALMDAGYGTRDPFSDPMNMGLLQAGLGMLQAGGPSPFPVSFGQAFSQGGLRGLGAYNQTKDSNIKNQFMQAKLQKMQQPENPFAKINPKDFTPESVRKFSMTRDPADLIPVQDVGVGPNGQVFDKRTVVPGTVLPPAEDEFSRALTAAGIVKGTPEYDRLTKARLDKMTQHPPAPNIQIDNRTGQSLAGQIGPMVAESRSAASGAAGTIDTANRIEQAIAAGNVNLGPGATIKTKADQLATVLGVAGQDTQERLVNTRNVIRGLAQSTVAARKALKGQGQVSDYEGKLLTRAESGEIDDFTLPELKDFVKLSKRLARQVHAEHARLVDRVRKDPNTASLADYYGLPDLPADAKTVVRKGRYLGKSVVEYSDGSIEYEK